jgi:hypothetical protein
MLAAMHNKSTMHLNRKGSVGHNFPFDAVWPKNNIGVSGAFENLFVHFPIARIVPAVPAGGVYSDLTAGFAAREVELQGPILECKRPVYGVQRRAKRPVHLALARIDSENNLVGWRLRRSMLRQSTENNQGDRRCRQETNHRWQTVS